MIHVKLPLGNENRRLIFYLAMEEYLAQLCEEELFFTWRVAPTVIYGRHQVVENEVNLEFCNENGIQHYRRKSGGGCVYADLGNLMLSYISPNVHSEQVFQEYLDKLVDVLSMQGFEAVKSQHNDVLIGDRKVSGNACYATPTGTIVHGTLLYDVDFDKLQQAITPSKEKLDKHGVKSVRQRVVNIKSLQNNSIEDIQDLDEKIIAVFCDKEIELTLAQILEIEKIEQTYLNL